MSKKSRKTKARAQAKRINPVDKLLADGLRNDSWTNTITGLGTSRDKATFTTYQAGRRLSDDEADVLYAENDMAARICDAVPEEALREGYSVVVATQDDAERQNAAMGVQSGESMTQGVDAGEAAEITQALDAAMDDLDVAKKVVDAAVWGRVFGFGALLLGADDGATGDGMAEPLGTVRRFDHINVLDKRYVTPLRYYTDPTAPKFGLPEVYLVTPNALPSGPTSAASSVGAPLQDRRLEDAQRIEGALAIHESRMIIFEGIRTSIRRRQQHTGFADSLLQRVNHTLTQFGVAWDSLGHLVHDANQGVYKMEGFIDALASDGENALHKRFAMMDVARSVVRAVVLDAESEDFQRNNTQFAGMDKIMQLFMIRLSAAARMPATILMSQSPAGMDATGESDLTWYYNLVATARTVEFAPALERIAGLLMEAQEGPTGGKVPDSWSVTFPPLWTPTAAEQADIRLKQAQTDTIYIADGVVTPAEVAVSRFPADGYSTETTIDLASRKIAMDLELDKLEEGPQDPPEMVAAPASEAQPAEAEPDDDA